MYAGREAISSPQRKVNRFSEFSFILLDEMSSPLAAKLIARSARVFQALAHMVEGWAIDLTTRIAAAQDFQRIPFKWLTKRHAPVAPPYPSTHKTTQQNDQSQPEQGKQRPEAYSPMHSMHMLSPSSVSYFLYSNTLLLITEIFYLQV
jgi:hypothetical protein